MRSSESTLVMPICKTNCDTFAISYHAPYVWNKLVIPLKNLSESNNFTYFKNNAKQVILNSENIVSEYF